jgi:hypothetical protein
MHNLLESASVVSLTHALMHLSLLTTPSRSYYSVNKRKLAWLGELVVSNDAILRSVWILQ